MGLVTDAWRGRRSLKEVFWIYGVLLPALCAAGIGILFASDVKSSAVLAGFAAFVLFVPVYFVWLLVSVWRCATVPRAGSVNARRAARVFVIVATLVLVAGPLYWLRFNPAWVWDRVVLSEARDLWNRNARQDYDLVVEDVSAWSSRQYLSEVRDGRAATVFVRRGEKLDAVDATDDARLWTVPALFDEAADWLSPFRHVEAEYDDTLGYPRSLFDPVPGYFDAWRIMAGFLLPPGEGQPLLEACHAKGFRRLEECLRNRQRELPDAPFHTMPFPGGGSAPPGPPATAK